ncbi:MAG: glycosyltransferase [Atopobiaceae bacterium]|nr:glycosyltransferase [Atopobiaceae bacterium]
MKTDERAAASQRPLVSVLIPVYNAERYLARCLDSVLQQTYENVQVVAVDDGSRDGSAALLDTYAELHPQVLVEHQANAGAAAARNRAIELAEGEYLCFLDNDDWLDLGLLEAFVDAALSTGAEVVCGGYRRPTQDGKVLFEAVPHEGDEWAPYLVEAAWAKLYRSDYVRSQGFRFLPTNIDEDLFFTLPSILLAERVAIVPTAGYNWFYNTESVSNTSQRSSEGLRFEMTMNDILGELDRRGIVPPTIVCHYFVRLVTWFLLFTCAGDGRLLARQNLRHYAAWLDDRFPGWRGEPYASPRHPTGDALANRLAVWLFARHRHLFALALDLYVMVGRRGR